ncbi:MAG: hypothetical protein M5U25_13745 [Planctomycetota bacterium]|nr:hypothetical protein [Planctomycetota bacterium]
MTEEEQVRMANEAPLTDEQARGAFCAAIRLVQDVMDMVNAAIQSVDPADANAIHAAQVAAQAKRIELFGVRERDAAILRAHPLFPLWKLVLQMAKQLESLLAVTNPQIFAARKTAELDARQALKQAQKLKAKAEAA